MADFNETTQAAEALVDLVSGPNADVSVPGGGTKPSWQKIADDANSAIQTEIDRTSNLFSATIYNNTTDGIANTSVGDFFSVVGADADDFLILYEHTTGGVATERKSYPSDVAVEQLITDVAELSNVSANNDQTNADRVEVVENANLLSQFSALVYANSGTPKTQSTQFAGYTTALTASSFDDFDRVNLHIQLDAPTRCRVSILDSTRVNILSVDIDGVDGWNEVTLPRLIKSDSDGSTIYIAIETIDRSFMTITTMSPVPPEYAPTGTFPVFATLASGAVGTWTNQVSSQFRIPFRLWNSHALSVDNSINSTYQHNRTGEILAASLTTGLADTKGGELEDTYGSFIGTVNGYATPYVTPTTPFDAMRTVIRTESATALRFYLKDDQLLDIEFADTEVLPAGDHFLEIALSKLYTSSELGSQFYMAVESIGHVSRIAVRNFIDDESKFPQPPSAFPLKLSNEAMEQNTWIGSGSATAARQYTEFFQLKNIKDNLATAVETAAQSQETLAIPSTFWDINGNRTLNIYYANTTRAAYASDFLYSVNSGLLGRQRADRWSNERTSIGSNTVTSQLYNKSRVLLDSKVSTLNQVSASAGSGENPVALFIGDSITARGFYTQDILDIAANDAMDITLIGTQGTAPNSFEGYGGQTVDWFFTNAASPFVFAGSFNFNQYMLTNNYSSVDYICMHLGVNDIFPASDGSGAISISESAAAQIEQMITQFKAFNPNVVFGLMLPITPSFNQDAWGVVYADGSTWWRYNSNRGEWCSVMIREFDNRSSENIHVIPTNLTINIETAYDVSDPIHPIDDGSGYEEMAQTVWAFLKAQEA